MLAAAALPQRGAFRKARESLPTRPGDGNVKGTVDKVEWTNPHIWIYVDTKDESGTVTRWQCEGGSPNTLTRQGWSRDSLKPGQQVSIEGFRAKNGSNTCNSPVVTTADGKRLFARSSFGQ